jgi:hypothetical protein
MTSTTAVRVPDEVLDEVKRIAALTGDTPGNMLAQAWTEFIERHRDELSVQFTEVARMLREGDKNGLASLSKQTRAVRASAAAARVRQQS